MQIQVPLSVPIPGEALGQANVLVSDPTPQGNIFPTSFSQALVELCATGWYIWVETRPTLRFQRVPQDSKCLWVVSDEYPKVILLVLRIMADISPLEFLRLNIILTHNPDLLKHKSPCRSVPMQHCVHTVLHSEFKTNGMAPILPMLQLLLVTTLLHQQALRECEELAWGSPATHLVSTNL